MYMYILSLVIFFSRILANKVKRLANRPKAEGDRSEEPLCLNNGLGSLSFIIKSCRRGFPNKWTFKMRCVNGRWGGSFIYVSTAMCVAIGTLVVIFLCKIHK